MAAPSVSGGFTLLEDCETSPGSGSGQAPIGPIGGTPSAFSSYAGYPFKGGIRSTGAGSANTSGSTTGDKGAIYSLGGNQDLSVANRLAVIHVTTSSKFMKAFASNGGIMMYANSNSTGTQEAAWSLFGSDNTPIGNFSAFVVNVSRSTNSYLHAGTFAPSAVSHIGLLANYTLTTSYSTESIDSVGYVDPYILLDGTVGDKCTFKDITDQIYTDYARVNESPTENIHLCMFGWGAGNGSTETHTAENLKTWEFAKTANFSELWGKAHINDNDLGYEENASANCTTSFVLCNWISETPFYWNSIGSTAATISYTSCVIQNAGDVTIVDGHTFDTVTFDSCSTINATDPTFTSVIIKDSTSTVALDITDASNIASATLSGNTTAMRFDFAGTASVTLTDVTFSSNTTDIEYTGSGVLTVTIDGGTTPTTNASGSGSIVVVAPTFDLTVDSSESASQIHVYTTTTQTILDSEASAAQLVYTHSNETVDITVLKDGFIPYRQTGLVLSGNLTVDVQLVASREYDSGHSLTYPTDASWASNQLTVPTFGVTGQGVFSLIMEAFKSETALRNTAFNIEMDGANSLYLVEDAEGASDASIENLIDCGCQYLDTSSAITATWSGVKSVGTATGFQGEYQQIDGTTTTDARATGVFNELIKVYGDASHGNFDYTDHLVLKYQPNTYREARSDVLADFGISVLAPTLYIVAMEPQAIDITSGDPAISITITDHTGAPLVVGGKSFDYEIVDNGANDGEAILRELNYNLSLGTGSYQGKDHFNWHEMALLSGSTYETVYGPIEGLAGLHGVYVSRSSADHPDFTRHQSNDGTYYVKPITANASISTIVSGSRVRIYNETTATETYNDVPGTSFSDSYTEGTTYTAGDVISIYITQISTTTAQAEYSTSVIASSTGWSVVAAQVSDDVYDTNGIDGSTLTGRFTADYVNDEIDFATATNFTGPEIYAFYMYSLTTASGIENFFGGFTALDAGNYRNNNAVVGMKLDNTTTTEVWQTDTSRIFRADETRPIRNPTSGGGGIDVNWQNVVYVVTAGSGLTAGQAAELTSASAAADVKTTTDQLVFTKANELDINVQSVNGTTISGAGTELDPWGP